MTSTGAGELSFARDIRPLFREKDRDSMMRAFDLLQQWIDQGKPA
jgi:hypothetical protein